MVPLTSTDAVAVDVRSVDPVSGCARHFTEEADARIIVSKETKIRNRYNQVPHLTQVTTQESDKNTIKHHIQETQEVSPFPADDHKAAMNRQENMTNTTHK